MIIGCLGKLWITPFIIILSGNPTDCDDITGAEAFEAAGVAKCSVATSKRTCHYFYNAYPDIPEVVPQILPYTAVKSAGAASASGKSQLL